MHIGPVCVCVYHADMISLRHSPPLFLSPSLSSRLLCPLPCSLPLASSLQGLGCFFPPLAFSVSLNPQPYTLTLRAHPSLLSGTAGCGWGYGSGAARTVFAIAGPQLEKPSCDGGS